MDTNVLSPREMIELIAQSPGFKDYVMREVRERLAQQFAPPVLPAKFISECWSQEIGTPVPVTSYAPVLATLIVPNKLTTGLPEGAIADHAYSKR
jgi:hypothetical protein